jgi:hypothetical protein
MKKTIIIKGLFAIEYQDTFKVLIFKDSLANLRKKVED